MATLITSGAWWRRGLVLLSRRAFFAWAALTCLVPHGAWAAEPLAARREVYALFLLNLTRFVKWPDDAFVSDESPLVVGVLRGDPLYSTLEEASRDEWVGSHPVTVRAVRTVADLESCHVVYFSRDYFPGAAQMLAQLRDRPVLTVSDADSFPFIGGHVQFYSQSGQVRILLDVENLRRSALVPSSQLLRVVTVTGRGSG